VQRPHPNSGKDRKRQDDRRRSNARFVISCSRGFELRGWYVAEGGCEAEEEDVEDVGEVAGDSVVVFGF
jgi:hypothetical protein